MSKRAAIYGRVSTDLQRGNYSIHTQISECLKYANTRDYPIVGDLFVDPETGRDADSGNGAVRAFVDDFSSRELSRPSLDAAFDFLENVGFDVLIVHSLDRLARDPYIRETLERDLISRGAKVEYVLGNYEESPEGEVRKDLDATFAKWENLKRVERSTRGKLRKAESGKFVSGRPPYGYQYEKNSPSGLVAIDKEADIVKEIFRLYVEEKFSIRGITEILTKRKIPTKMGGGKWGKSTVPKILRNSTYVGRCYYNKHKRDGKHLIVRSKDEWIEIETPRIVDEWIFEEAQQVLALNRKLKRKQPSRFYLLSGMVFCESCGRPYIAQTAKAGKHGRVNDAQSYRHRVIEGHCINRMISARRLEPLVWDEIVSILLEPERLREGYKASIEQQKNTHAREIAHLESLRKAFVHCKEERNNLTALYIDPEIKITRMEYIEQKTRIDDEIKRINNDIEIVEKRIPNVPLPGDFDNLDTFASKIRERLFDARKIKPEDKRKILELLHVKVILGTDSSIRLEGWFGKDSDWLSSTTSKRYVNPPRRLPGRV